MKICSKCKKEKELSLFYRDKNTKDGFNSACKKCRKKYNRSAKEAKKYFSNHLESYLVSLAKQRAKKKNISFDLKSKDIVIPNKANRIKTNATFEEIEMVAHNLRKLHYAKVKHNH